MNKEDLKNIPFIRLSGKCFTYSEVEPILNPFLSRRVKKPEFLSFIEKHEISDHATQTQLRNVVKQVESMGLYQFLAKRLTSSKYKHFLFDSGLTRLEIRSINDFAYGKDWPFSDVKKEKRKVRRSITSMNWFDNNALTC